MKVILTENVRALGNIGELVSVSDGFARNFLIPNKKAVLADEANKRVIEDHKKRLAKKIADQKDQAQNLKKNLDALSFDLVKRVGGNGKLYGAVTNVELAQELQNRGFDVERRMIILENPLKQLGDFSVKVKLFTDVEANFNVKITLDPKQAEEFKAKQHAALLKKAKDAELEKNKREQDNSESEEIMAQEDE